MSEHEPKEIVFFGKITAGMTHEMKNVLAIVKESAGLMEDLIQLDPSSAESSHAGRMLGALKTINEQVNRGVELTSRLNRFAHDADRAIQSFDVNDLMRNLIALTQRFARLKNVTLAMVPGPEPIMIESRAVLLQMLLFVLMEAGLEALQPGAGIEIHPRLQADVCDIRLHFRDKTADPATIAATVLDTANGKMLGSLLGRLGGSADTDGGSESLVIHLPRRVHPPGAFSPDR